MNFSFDPKDVFTFKNKDQAKKYVKQQGYFGFTMEDIEEQIHQKYSYKTLKSVGKYKHPFLTYQLEDDFYLPYPMFLPLEKVNKKED